ncbi:MAG: hypothetical protein ACI4D9_00520 [Lachnospiraceae bacterium]
MDEYINKQKAINTVATSYRYESDRLTALQEIPSKTEKEIAKDEIMNFAVAILAEVAEFAKQEDAPIYEGDKEVDQWVRLSDVNVAINKHLNSEE